VQGFAPSCRRCDDQDLALESIDESLQLGDRMRFAAVDRNRRNGLGQSAAGLFNVESVVALGQTEEGIGRQKQLGWRQQWAILVARQQTEPALRVGPERLPAGSSATVGHDTVCWGR